MMTKRMSILLALLLALLPIAAAYGETTYYVSTGNHKSVNMRADTSTDSTVITTIPYGAAVGFLGLCDNPNWASVYYGNNNGYVMMRYLSTKKPGSSSGSSEPSGYQAFTATDYYATVTPSTPNGYVNLRWDSRIYTQNTAKEIPCASLQKQRSGRRCWTKIPWSAALC